MILFFISPTIAPCIGNIADNIDVTAKNVSLNQTSNTMSLSGDVVASIGEGRLTAETASARFSQDMKPEKISLKKNIHGNISGMEITAESGVYYADTKTLKCKGSPVKISSALGESITADEVIVKNHTILTAQANGSVEVKNKTYTLKSASITTYFKKTANKPLLSKAVANTRLNISSEKYIIDADKGYYENGILYLTDNVIIKNGSNVIFANSAQVNLSTGSYKISGEKSPINAVIQSSRQSSHGR